MRSFTRPLVQCPNCGAEIYWGLSAPGSGPNAIPANAPEPPDVVSKCPRCGGEVDTTTAYAAVPGFPLQFETLRRAYDGFVPICESHRQSFESLVDEFFKKQSMAEIEDWLKEREGFEWFRQRMFYRSCTAFYRSLQLFFAFLVLERRCFVTWATVTGYYSRFFFIQAFLNLLMLTWDSLHRCVFFFDDKSIQCLPQKVLSPTIKNAQSHEVWWQFMEAVKLPLDYPVKDLQFILSRLLFNPDARNNANYGFEYLGGGFIELDWFDQGARQMMSHFMPHPRADEDITDMDRFFAGCDPENCDVGDFYGDNAQILWCSLIGYLQLVSKMGFKQEFILTENVAALAELHLRNDYPNLMRGVLLSVHECLGDEFDVDAFMKQRESDPVRLSSFLLQTDICKSRLAGM